MLRKWLDRFSENKVWRVIYQEDGGRTRPLTYHEAKGLADLFQGEVVHEHDLPSQSRG